jgi:hypothetical protein
MANGLLMARGPGCFTTCERSCVPLAVDACDWLLSLLSPLLSAAGEAGGPVVTRLSGTDLSCGPWTTAFCFRWRRPGDGVHGAGDGPRRWHPILPTRPPGCDRWRAAAAVIGSLGAT